MKKLRYKVPVHPDPVAALKLAQKTSLGMAVSGQFNCTKDTGFMPFLLSVLLSFQGYSHLFGVGSFSY